jgi:hypothetical protein
MISMFFTVDERKSINERAKHLPQVYVLGTGSHAVAVVDGFYYDAWESGREQPIFYYEKGE